MCDQYEKRKDIQVETLSARYHSINCTLVPLSFQGLVEMMHKRELSLAHTTIMRWVHQYGLALDTRIRCHLKQTNDSWRGDETYIKVKGQWMYLYRAGNSEGNTIDFYLSKSRNHKAAKRCQQA
ncbi:unnamed protein product [Bacillus thuringiensis DB27]|uniref:DDE domain-containing protein n=1 Tax=Bacillus thuringiensis DB27 TaxID=1431339 RepID=W8YDJ2_BACTU|nr:unnamed protein product [Bacillus thuringiensis DB27]